MRVDAIVYLKTNLCNYRTFRPCYNCASYLAVCNDHHLIYIFIRSSASDCFVSISYSGPSCKHFIAFSFNVQDLIIASIASSIEGKS